ncbi:MAG TPA: hypothetical protein VII58_00840 [Acidobacteriaceae bacterium]
MNFQSLFAKVEGAEKSTMAFIEKTLAEVESKAPSIERVVDAGLEYVGPVLQIALAAEGQTALAADIGPIIAKAQNVLVATSATITDFGPTPTAASAFASVASNLGALLAAGQIKSPKSVAAVTKAVSEIGHLGSAVQVAAAAIAASALPAAA